MDQENTSAISRRNMLKKTAAVGAVAWTAPMIMSSPAFAATTVCGGSQPCKTFYYVKNEGGANIGGTGDSTCLSFTLAQLTAGCPGQNQTLSSGGGALVTQSWSGNIATFTFPAGVIPLYVQLKVGNAGAGNALSCFTFQYNGIGSNLTMIHPVAPTAGCEAGNFLTSAVAFNGGVKITITYPNGCLGGISHIGAWMCN